jgi:predicted Zn finger-like uncharacterized protein
MKITCGSCGAKYTVSDEKVQGKTVKVKCRKCGAVIVVSSTGEVQTTGSGGSHAGPAPTGATYTVSVSDTDQRTMTLAQIIDAYNEGTIDAETFVWAEGMDDWQALKDVDAIVDALHDAAASETDALGGTVAMNTPSSQAPGSYRPAAAGSYPPAAGSYPPAAAQQGLGGTVAMAQSPLGGGGGGIAAAAGGGGGGFFAASGGGSFGGSSFTDVAAPTGGNGQPRTEDSAIFSLNMLTSKVGGSPGSSPPSSTSTTTSEDSGLIDLKALAQGMGNESAAGAASTPAPMAADGLFPLGAPPPQAMAPAPSISVAPPEAKGRGLILGLAALVVVMGAALLFILVRDSGEQPTTPSAAPVATPTPTPAITEEPDPEPKVANTATASASASSSAAPKVAVGRGPRPQPGAAPQPGTAPKPVPKASGGPCGCSSDDLMCHMRCSQKKK